MPESFKKQELQLSVSPSYIVSSREKKAVKSSITSLCPSSRHIDKQYNADNWDWYNRRDTRKALDVTKQTTAATLSSYKSSQTTVMDKLAQVTK